MQQINVTSKWFVLARPNPLSSVRSFIVPFRSAIARSFRGANGDYQTVIPRTILTHLQRLMLLLLLCSLLTASALADKPHAVFVVGTTHYSPAATMPGLAKQLEASGFRTTVVLPDGNPERNEKGIDGLDALKDADVAVFFMRFLTLPNDQLKLIEDYVKEGKPVVAFRTSTHAFSYPRETPNSKWNDGFGRDVLGSKYFMHLAGSTTVVAAGEHEILNRVDFKKPQTAAGTLYLSKIPKDATVLLRGTGSAKKVGEVRNAFGTHHLKKTMTQDVAWTWKNQWGGRVFVTTLGHPKTFADQNFVRLFLNGIHWAAGKPVPHSLAAAPIRAVAVQQRKTRPAPTVEDAKNRPTGAPDPPHDPAFAKYAIYENTAPRAVTTEPSTTTLPLELKLKSRIALIGNTLLERSGQFGQFEAMLHQQFPKHELAVRHLAWSADEIDVQPRPANFADTEQHLMHERADVIFAAFGFNESFAGPAGLDTFRRKLTDYVANLKTKAFNGQTAPQIVLISPIANENIEGVAAADLNNARLELYTAVMRDVAREQRIGFASVFNDTQRELQSPGSDLTINGVHLTQAGDQLFASSLFHEVFGEDPPEVNQSIREIIVDKNRQFFRRFRPVNTFYYTGGRNKSYGYLDFLPAMRNFDMLVANRDRRIWDLAQGRDVPAKIDDSNIPLLPQTKQSRGANRWMSAAEEQKAFKIDPRFELNLFAGEEQFPDIANPIQMRWDPRGRLWVSCSTTYPHVYPGNEPNDKLVILEDTDGDGRADKSTVFADDLQIPLSFEFGDGGVYLSEQPNLTFLKDTDGDDSADVHEIVLSGFGTEDSHHSLHDLTWTPDGNLIFRESIFHHSQVETPYGPVRQQNSGWFRFEPRTHRLISFGTYHSTNPWGVTFDDWGQHMASHPVYAAAFHSLDPPFPQQHPSPKGLQAYSGVCGHQFVDFATFPEELQGDFIKVRYKPTNRIEIHEWVEGEFGYNEQYVSDLLFSTNLSFIPVDLQWGPRGALYVCDWYNPVKGHAQYSLRDPRRDRHSGRIWRITTKGKPLQDLQKIDGASIDELLDLLKRPEYRIRDWAKRELHSRNLADVKTALDAWVVKLDPSDPRFRHHQIEAIWTYRWIGLVELGGRGALAQHTRAEFVSGTRVLGELLDCDDHHARAAATHQLRYWHPLFEDAASLLNRSANDTNAIVRMEAAIAASYIGTKQAFEAILDVFKHSRDGHVAYAIVGSLGSHTLRPFWENDNQYGIAELLKRAAKKNVIKEPTPSASQAQFDSQTNLKLVKISCVPERMLFSVNSFTAKPGQPVKVVFINPDATDHNFVLVKPGALAEVGMAANEMAKDPRNANSDFIPREKRDLILHASPMIGPTRPSLVHVLRFTAPAEAGIYRYVCTFPGHWVVMNGVMVVADDKASADALLAASQPKVIKQWTMADFADFAKIAHQPDEATVVRGMTAFVKARCNQCHVVAGHGVNLGPDLAESVKKLKGEELLRQIIEPSSKIHEEFQNHQFLMDDGRVITGVIAKEDKRNYHVASNLLTPNTLTQIRKRDVDERIASKVSPMPIGMLNVLTRNEILDLHAFVETGGYQLPEHLKHLHQHESK